MFNLTEHEFKILLWGMGIGIVIMTITAVVMIQYVNRPKRSDLSSYL